MDSLSEVWQQVLSILSETLTQVAINTWFSDCRAVALTADKFVLEAPSAFKKNIIESRFTEQLQKALYDIFSSQMTVEVLDAQGAEQFRTQSKSSPEAEEQEP